MYIANIFILVYKIINKKLQENIITQINYNKKKLIKTAFNIQKIIQKNNIFNYY